MVSSIKEKKQKRVQEKEKTEKKTDIMAFIRSLVNTIIGIVLSIVMYVSVTKAYYNYNTPENLPTNPNNMPYAPPSSKSSMQQKFQQGKQMASQGMSVLQERAKQRMMQTSLGKKANQFNTIAKNLDRQTMQRGGAGDKVSYFYRKGNSIVGDWIANILIYSWSSLRGNVREFLPDKQDGASINDLGYFGKQLVFFITPLIMFFGAVLTMIVGSLRTFYGVFATSPTLSALMMAVVLVIFPFPILAPVFGIMAFIVGILQSGWMVHFFGFRGFIESEPGTFTKTARRFTNSLSIMLSLGLMSAASYLPEGVANGINIASVIMILLAVGNMARNAFGNTSPEN